MEKKFFEIPEFTDEILKEISEADIEIGGEERLKLWESGKINIDYIKESYNKRRAFVNGKKLIAEGKKPEKFQTPFRDEICRKFSESNDISEESIKKHFENYDNASRATMRYFVKHYKKFQGGEN